jgi:hypothetical protein
LQNNLFSGLDYVELVTARKVGIGRSDLMDRPALYASGKKILKNFENGIYVANEHLLYKRDKLNP